MMMMRRAPFPCRRRRHRLRNSFCQRSRKNPQTNTSYSDMWAIFRERNRRNLLKIQEVAGLRVYTIGRWALTGTRIPRRSHKAGVYTIGRWALTGTRKWRVRPRSSVYTIGRWALTGTDPPLLRDLLQVYTIGRWALTGTPWGGEFAGLPVYTIGRWALTGT